MCVIAKAVKKESGTRCQHECERGDARQISSHT